MAAAFEELQSPDPFGELEPWPMSEDNDRSGLYQRTFSELPKGTGNVFIRVWRIQNDEIVGGGFVAEVALHRLAVNGALARKLGSLQVLLNHGRRRGGHFHKIGMAGAAREGFDTDCSGASIEIEHAVWLDAQGRER